MDERYAEETQTLRELLAIMHEHDLDTIKVKLGDAVYELSRRAPEAAVRRVRGPPPRRSRRRAPSRPIRTSRRSSRR